MTDIFPCTEAKKVLIVATITAHINGFHIPYIKWLKQKRIRGTRGKQWNRNNRGM